MMDGFEEFLTTIPAMIGSKEGAINPPVSLSASYSYGSSQRAEDIFSGEVMAPVYARVGNPTTAKLESLLTYMDGGIGAIATSSGMAAITMAILSVCQSGDEVIAVWGLFGGSYALLTETLPRYGITTHFFDVDDLITIEAGVTDKTKMIFCESVGNPNMKLPDLRALGELASRKGVVFAVDNTVTPLAVKPLALGADMAVYSTTKIMTGNASALGGAVVFRALEAEDRLMGRCQFLKPFYQKVGSKALVMGARKRVLRDFGMSANAMASYLTINGLETLALRTLRITQSCEILAKTLWDAGVNVRHPSLPHHEHYDRYQHDFTQGCGPLVTIDAGTKERAFAFLDRLKHPLLTANIGDSRTLALHMASTIYRDFDQSSRLALGVSDGLIRLSVGLENPSILAEDMIQSWSQIV